MDIVLENLCKSYGDHIVLNKFSAVIPAGQATAIMAPSGCGKTTLLRILMGLEQADSGSISGLSHKKISAVFQEDRLCKNLSPVSNIRLVAPELKKSDIIAAMEQVGLTGCFSQPVRELSGGMKRRVAILRALLADYDILFLDEPFKGLDADTRRLVAADTRKKSAGKTVVLITHEKEDISLMGVRQILTIDTGKSAVGSFCGCLATKITDRRNTDKNE